jgi:hypothetical protein
LKFDDNNTKILEKKLVMKGSDKNLSSFSNIYEKNETMINNLNNNTKINFSVSDNLKKRKSKFTKHNNFIQNTTTVLNSKSSKKITKIFKDEEILGKDNNPGKFSKILKKEGKEEKEEKFDTIKNSTEIIEKENDSNNHINNIKELFNYLYSNIVYYCKCCDRRINI